ncbi:MAG TPA: S8 family serine peptidase [Allosphingosinicella sp.]|nr:S8 family serine peptidase [Allosphingosinicella sp.]
MDENVAISTDVVNRLLYGHGDRQRYTQETPILPEVWQNYAKSPAEPQDLLITPLESSSAVALLRSLLEPEPGDDKQALRARAHFAPLQSFLAARLTFRELIRYLLPRTEWAQKAWQSFEKEMKRRKEARQEIRDFAEFAFRQAFRSALTPVGLEEVLKDEKDTEPQDDRPLSGQLLDIARILTLTAIIFVAEEQKLEGIRQARNLATYHEAIVACIRTLLDRLATIAETAKAEADRKKGVGKKKEPPLIWRIASNRPIRLADEYARATVKADAAFRLFDVKCETITWAVIDSGVDKTHRGFLCDPEDKASGSRVVQTYDFSILRELLDPAYRDEPEKNPKLAEAQRRSKLPPEEALRHLTNLYQSFDTEMLDWSSIEPLIAVADPDPPDDGHGTHVAGIIGADMRDEDDPSAVVVQGLCPDIRLMDFRIISGTLEDTEFAVIGALQLVRYLNSHNQYVVVHGVNLSLSIPHVVESFACGRTPVCDECERLVGAGVTVVAAAGNNGYHKFQTEKGVFPGYATLSITDPGNADAVITVGATHRRDPHTYGVSYFSSRGPTGDGRMKPDLVAPGERIESTLPRGEVGSLDGTSQAAPHVSAAAAMLMARYPELNRSPRRIKRILCESATDLGRERAFQGHGLLDILRALQSF